MKPNDQLQDQQLKQGSQSQSQSQNTDASKHQINNGHSQNETTSFPKPKPKPPAHQAAPVTDKDAGNQEDFEADEKETTGETNRNEDKEEEQAKAGTLNNDDWKTGDSGIPENASDNPNS